MVEQAIDQKAEEVLRAQDYLFDITAGGDKRKYDTLEGKMRKEFDEKCQTGDESVKSRNFGQYMIDQVNAMREDPEVALRWERAVESELQHRLNEKNADREYQEMEKRKEQRAREAEQVEKQNARQQRREELEKKTMQESELWRRIK